MQTTAIRTVANSLPEKGVILLTLLISDRYILFAELFRNFAPVAAQSGIQYTDACLRHRMPHACRNAACHTCFSSEVPKRFTTRACRFFRNLTPEL